MFSYASEDCRETKDGKETLKLNFVEKGCWCSFFYFLHRVYVIRNKGERARKRGKEKVLKSPILSIFISFDVFRG
jgi:hypothetical protein